MVNKRRLISMVIFCAAFALPEYASAASLVVPGSRPGTDSGIVTYSDGQGVAVPVRSGWSYYCRYRAAFGVNIDFKETLQNLDASTVTTGKYRGDSDGGTALNAESDDAISFTATTTEVYYLIITDIAPDNQPAIIECFVTSLFGNFNTVTAANPYNFLEISNDSNKSINFKVTFYKYDGTQLATVSESLAAGRQRDLSVHDVSGASDTFGRVLISHDGPPQVLRASLSKYIDLGGGSLRLIATIPYKTLENTN